MPNLPQQQTIVQYVTNSSQMIYTFAFYAPLPTDIQVFYQASNAPPIPATDILLLNTNYTVTYNADPTTGGFITLLFTPTSGYYLTINRQVLASLNTNFATAQNFNGANLDAALDRLLLLCQQNQNYNLYRNLSYVINTYLPNATPYTQLPTLPQNYIWVGSGSGVVAALLASSPSASVLQSMLANSSPGTDGARLVGYYDNLTSSTTTVDAFLQNIVPYLKTNLQFSCAYSNPTNTTITNATATAVPYATKIFDTFGTTVVNGTFTAPRTGKYLVSAIIDMTQNNQVGTIELRAYINGIQSNNFDYKSPIYQSGSPISVCLGGTLILPLSAGDLLVIAGYQSSGGSLSMSNLDVNTNTLNITQVG